MNDLYHALTCGICRVPLLAKIGLSVVFGAIAVFYFVSGVRVSAEKEALKRLVGAILAILCSIIAAKEAISCHPRCQVRQQNYEQNGRKYADTIATAVQSDWRGSMNDLYHALTCRNCHWCRCDDGMWAMAMICPMCGRRDRLAFASFRPHEWREAEAYLETRIPGLYVSEMTDHKPAGGVVFVDDRLTSGNWYVIGDQEHEIAIPQA